MIPRWTDTYARSGPIFLKLWWFLSENLADASRRFPLVKFSESKNRQFKYWVISKSLRMPHNEQLKYCFVPHLSPFFVYLHITNVIKLRVTRIGHSTTSLFFCRSPPADYWLTTITNVSAQTSREKVISLFYNCTHLLWKRRRADKHWIFVNWDHDLVLVLFFVCHL